MCSSIIHLVNVFMQENVLVDDVAHLSSSWSRTGSGESVPYLCSVYLVHPQEV